MKCFEVHSLIPEYIKDKIPDKMLEEFILHVRNCSSCYHELETYYMIHKGIKVLDEDSNASYDLQKMLVDDLKKKEDRIKANKRIKVYVTIYILILLILILCVWILAILPEDYNFIASFGKWLEHMLYN